jgi:hypothetical protein
MDESERWERRAHCSEFKHMSSSRLISAMGNSGRSIMNCNSSLSWFLDVCETCSRNRRSQRS